MYMLGWEWCVACGWIWLGDEIGKSMIGICKETKTKNMFLILAIDQPNAQILLF
jgi:hypothetical protein